MFFLYLLVKIITIIIVMKIVKKQTDHIFTSKRINYPILSATLMQMVYYGSSILSVLILGQSIPIFYSYAILFFIIISCFLFIISNTIMPGPFVFLTNKSEFFKINIRVGFIASLVVILGNLIILFGVIKVSLSYFSDDQKVVQSIFLYEVVFIFLFNSLSSIIVLGSDFNSIANKFSIRLTKYYNIINGFLSFLFVLFLIQIYPDFPEWINDIKNHYIFKYVSFITTGVFFIFYFLRFTMTNKIIRKQFNIIIEAGLSVFNSINSELNSILGKSESNDFITKLFGNSYIYGESPDIQIKEVKKQIINRLNFSINSFTKEWLPIIESFRQSVEITVQNLDKMEHMGGNNFLPKTAFNHMREAEITNFQNSHFLLADYLLKEFEIINDLLLNINDDKDIANIKNKLNRDNQKLQQSLEFYNLYYVFCQQANWLALFFLIIISFVSYYASPEIALWFKGLI